MEMLDKFKKIENIAVYSAINSPRIFINPHKTLEYTLINLCLKVL